MDDHSTPFAHVLARHIEGHRLRDAFDWCNRQQGLQPYERTNLGRWLEGTIPTREAFIVALAGRLGDDSVYQTWLDAQKSRSSEEVKGVITRFLSLGPEEKATSFRQIAASMARSPSIVRSNFSVRIDIYDSPDPGLFRLRVEMNWTGHLPANAKIIFVAEQSELAAAGADNCCIYRDVSHMNKEDFAQAMARGKNYRQQLSYVEVEGTRDPTLLTAESTEAGHFEFSNEEVPQAHIKVRATYPFPHGRGFYPFEFTSKHQVAGPFRITIVLHSDSTTGPQYYSFLGHDSQCQASEFGDELTIEAGHEHTVLGVGTGLVFYWSES